MTDPARRPMPRRWHLPSLLVPGATVHLLVLIALWLLLWDQLSVANLLSGIAVAVVLVVAFPIARQHRRWYTIRPLHTAHFVGHVVWKAIEANVWLTREVVSRRSRIRTGIVATPVPGCSEELLTFIANTIALTPGTMVVEASAHPPTLYVHVLDLRSIDAVRAEVHRLAVLAVRAFGSPEALAAIEAVADGRGKPPIEETSSP